MRRRVEGQVRAQEALLGKPGNVREPLAQPRHALAGDVVDAHVAPRRRHELRLQPGGEDGLGAPVERRGEHRDGVDLATRGAERGRERHREAG